MARLVAWVAVLFALRLWTKRCRLHLIISTGHIRRPAVLVLVLVEVVLEDRQGGSDV